jgi:hypothetical protein
LNQKKTTENTNLFEPNNGWEGNYYFWLGADDEVMFHDNGKDYPIASTEQGSK